MINSAFEGCDGAGAPLVVGELIKKTFDVAYDRVRMLPAVVRYYTASCASLPGQNGWVKKMLPRRQS